MLHMDAITKEIGSRDQTISQLKENQTKFVSQLERLQQREE